jgi:hypothetical protein
MDKEKIDGTDKRRTVESLACAFIFSGGVHRLFAVHRVSYGNGIGSDIFLSFEWRGSVYGLVAH